MNYVYSRPCRIQEQSRPQINNPALPMSPHPRVLGLTLDAKLTYSTHIYATSVRTHKPLQLLKVLTTKRWGKQKEILMATYKAVTRPVLEYASSMRSPIASSTSINKRQGMQNAALMTATACTQDTTSARQNVHTSPTRSHTVPGIQPETQHPSHPLHIITHFNTPRIKQTFFNNATTQQTCYIYTHPLSLCS